MENLPNGFTGFAGLSGRPEGFESAAEASRRSRGIAPESAKAPSSSGARQRYRDLASAGKAEGVIPFDEAQLERISALDQRWAWVEVDASAIRHNVATLRRMLRPRCRMMAVVEADGYGHGAVEASKAALGAGADRLAVSSVSEGVSLRKAGITAPILVLGQPPAASIPLLLGYQLTPAVYEPDFAIAYGEAADLHGMKAPYHLAVNTGMNRLGVRHDEALSFLFQVNFHRALELEGVFTHYATADCPETLDFHIQAKRFVEVVNEIKAARFEPGIVHCASSAAALRYPEVQFDMVRLGSVLYGMHPCPETRALVDLRPAMSVHARIVDTRLLPVSEGVSFGLHYRSPGSVKVCTVPIGYADGLHRSLSGDIDFIMGGRYYRQVGSICMHYSMFEVDMRNYASRERVDPQVGDEVIVVGSQGIAEISVDEMAEKLRTIPCEVTVGFGQRLARTYH